MNQLKLAEKEEDVANSLEKSIEENRKYQSHTIMELPNFGPTICIAAGTTLDDSWGKIKALKHGRGCKIICVSRALICCQNEGVMPDYVMHVDITNLANTYWDNLHDDYLKKPTLITSPGASPVLLSKWRGDILMYMPSLWDGVETAPKKFEPALCAARLPEFNHVGATSVSLVLALGGEPILFGHDHWFRAAKVNDPRWGETVVCFQKYAAPIYGHWIGYRNSDIRCPLIRDNETYVQHTWPYEIGPNMFTTDQMQSNKRKLLEVFKFYHREVPECLLK